MVNRLAKCTEMIRIQNFSRDEDNMFLSDIIVFIRDGKWPFIVCLVKKKCWSQIACNADNDYSINLESYLP